MGVFCAEGRKKRGDLRVKKTEKTKRRGYKIKKKC